MYRNILRDILENFVSTERRVTQNIARIFTAREVKNVL
jgi:hypothetical protein